MHEFTAELTTAGVVEIHVSLLPEPGSDAEELAQLTDLLREELLELDVGSLRYPDGPALPDTAKGSGAVLGALIVQLGASDGIKSVVAAVRGWSARMNRTVEINIDGDVLKMTGATADQTGKIIDAWIARHAEH
ncbi:hypothetical protein HS048_35215 [Planomonospora sp. ID91781]|uniref:hypothetical protein n=1 Tax=Planomonospora sp. ID91781 TaxID=2738135 RepID=UPI0018C437B3|nr:hypothetical protein [Planomonospora sp. ID91781]MBG0825926.1 hypothetical protein [Planomonospora sp. ID91781]